MDSFLQIVEPWLGLLFVLLIFIPTERWIHQHLFGIGYLLTENEESATTIYYLIFMPGVLLHESIQWLLAGALNIPIKTIEPRPQRQLNGTLRYNFVVIEKTDRWRRMIMGGAPFLAGMTLVWYISTQLLELQAIPLALAEADLVVLGDAIRNALLVPDFWLWFFLLFTLSNGIIPTREDRDGWGLILAAMAGLSVVLIVIGAGNVVFDTLTGPIHDTLVEINTAFAALFLVNLFFILILGIVEDTLERWRGYKMDYSANDAKLSAAPKERKREPGSKTPIPRGEPMPSIYNLAIPLPPIPNTPPARRPLARPAPAAESSDAPSRLGSPFPRPSSPPPPAEPSDAPARPSSSFSRPTPPTPAASEPTGDPARPSSPFSRPTPPTPAASEPTGDPARPSSPFSRPTPPTRPESPPETAESRVQDALQNIQQGGLSSNTSSDTPRLSPEERRARMDELIRRREEPTSEAINNQPDESEEDRRRAQLEEFRRRRESQQVAPPQPPSIGSPDERRARLEEFRRRREEQGANPES